MQRRALFVVVSTLLALAMTTAPADAGGGGGRTTKNLIRNPGADSGMGARNDSTVVRRLPRWHRAGGTKAQVTAVRYGAEGGFPDKHTPGPKDRGKNFFAGGPANTSQFITQLVSVRSYERTIKKGKTHFTFEAWLGGHKGERDYAVVVFSFLSKGGNILGSVTLGPTDTHEKTTFVQRIETGKVPGKTRVIEVSPMFHQIAGSTYDDAYVDSISLTLSGV